MKSSAIKLLCALVTTGAAAAAITGCGNDVPAGGVAKVGDTVIRKAEFDKWLGTATAGAAQSGQAATYDPPDYSKCVAAKKKQPLPKGSKQPSDATLKKQCKQEYDQLKKQVMQFLIQAEWVQQEAQKQGIKVSDKEVKQSFEDQKKQAFPNDKAYQQFLKTSGMSEEDVLFRVKLDQLQQKLTQKITEKSSKVSDQDIEDYYNKNKKRFAQPERRDLRIVLTKSEDKANQAKDAIDSGQPFKQVVKKYSIDEASKAQGGLLPSVAKGQQEKALDDAVFSAKKGELKGPVKTQFGWYVFEVQKVTPASQQSLDQSKDTIRNLLRSQRQQKTLDDWIKDFRSDYRDKTTCADDYEISECDNGPQEDSNTGPVSGGSPQGQPAPTPQTQGQAPQTPQTQQGQGSAPQPQP
jgi:foldase protein PrsA